MYCVIMCIVRGNQARVKNADLLHPSCTVVMYRHKSASPVHNVLMSGNSETGSMYCVIMCIVRGNQARVKNADLLYPSCTVVMYRRKSASPVHSVLMPGTCDCRHHLHHYHYHDFYSLTP